jgi:hypothetical protein
LRDYHRGIQQLLIKYCIGQEKIKQDA